MSRFLKLLWLLGLTTMVATAPAWSQKQKADERASARQIDEILSEVQVALVKVQNEVAAQSLPKLSSVFLELETQFAYAVGGELKLYVVSAEGKTENTNSQRVSLTLKPPKAYSEEPVGRGQVSESLSTAILAAAKGIASARKRKPPLILDKLEAEIKFVVKASGEGGVKVELLPISVGMTGDISKNAIQKITVNFENDTK